MHYLKLEEFIKKIKTGMLEYEYISPKVILSPKQAFYGAKEQVEISKTSGRVCTEFVMCYPPGIPILSPGEQVTDEIIDYINYAKDKGLPFNRT